ncbi:hypothetical protein AX774_g6223, partial [Zancudomyces culisetae]
MKYLKLGWYISVAYSVSGTHIDIFERNQQGVQLSEHIGYTDTSFGQSHNTLNKDTKCNIGINRNLANGIGSRPEASITKYYKYNNKNSDTDGARKSISDLSQSRLELDDNYKDESKIYSPLAHSFNEYTEGSERRLPNCRRRFKRCSIKQAKKKILIECKMKCIESEEDNGVINKCIKSCYSQTRDLSKRKIWKELKPKRCLTSCKGCSKCTTSRKTKVKALFSDPAFSGLIAAFKEAKSNNAFKAKIKINVVGGKIKTQVIRVIKPISTPKANTATSSSMTKTFAFTVAKTTAVDKIAPINLAAPKSLKSSTMSSTELNVATNAKILSISNKKTKNIPSKTQSYLSKIKSSKWKSNEKLKKKYIRTATSVPKTRKLMPTSSMPALTTTSEKYVASPTIRAAVVRMVGAVVTPSTPAASTPLSSAKSLTTPTLKPTPTTSPVAVPSSRTYSKQKWDDKKQRRKQTKQRKLSSRSKLSTPTSTSSSSAQIQSVQAAVARMVGAVVTPSTPAASTPLSSAKSLTTPTLRSTPKSSSVAVPSSRSYSKQKWGDKQQRRKRTKQQKLSSRSKLSTPTSASSSRAQIQSAQAAVARMVGAVITPSTSAASTPLSLSTKSLTTPTLRSTPKSSSVAVPSSRSYSKQKWGDKQQRRKRTKQQKLSSRSKLSTPTSASSSRAQIQSAQAAVARMVGAVITPSTSAASTPLSLSTKSLTTPTLRSTPKSSSVAVPSSRSYSKQKWGDKQQRRKRTKQQKLSSRSKSPTPTSTSSSRAQIQSAQAAVARMVGAVITPSTSAASTPLSLSTKSLTTPTLKPTPTTSSIAVPSSRTHSKQKWGDEWRKKIERQKARSKARSRPHTPTSTSSSRAQIQ